MEIIYFIALWGAVFLGGLLLKRAQVRLLYYLGLSVLFAGAAAALYFAFSQWAGIVRIGVSTDRNIPQDYFDNGPGGLAAFVAIVLGIASPAAAVWITGRLKTGRHRH